MSGCSKDDGPPDYTKATICDISSKAAAEILGTRGFEASDNRRSTMPFDGDAPRDNLDGNESRTSCTVSTGDTALVLQGKIIGPGEADVAHKSAESLGHVFHHADGLGGVKDGSGIWACGQVQLTALTRGDVDPDDDALQEVLPTEHVSPPGSPCTVGGAANDGDMLLADVVATSAAVAATRSRTAKVAALAELLRRAADAGSDVVPVVTSYLAGVLRQRRTGLGWRSLQALPDPADHPTLEVTEVDAAFERIAVLAGAGSQVARADATRSLFARATADEQRWLRGLVTGEVRQGALDSLVQEGLAVAGGVPAAAVRRAAMMAGSTVDVATAALTGGEDALAAFTLQVGRPVLPMLASTAPTVEAAMAKAGGGEVAIDTKLDGVRIQVHRRGDDVLVVTRSLDDVTDRHPEVVTIARALTCHDVVLDGEVLALGPDGRPRPFQETASRAATAGGTVRLTPAFFDLLHLDGLDLVDSPTTERLAVLERVVPEQHRVPRLVTADADEGEEFAAQVLALGHEGVVVKSLTAPYAAGRRGTAWVKVKPVHTLDLVVLAVERGSGRRSGWLSNIHLGARSGDGFVMLGKTFKEPLRTDWVPVGKTFKGMTDEMLAWQTERFRELQVSDDGWIVTVRPEQVVEIAFDGVQRSSRYPGGVALRFARVVRYRDDKRAEEADTIDTLRSYLSP